MCHVSHATCHLSHVMCHVSRVTCYVSPVTFHLSLTPTATATDHTPSNQLSIQSRLVCKDQKKIKRKNHQNCKNSKTSRGMPILATVSPTRSLELQPFGHNLKLQAMGPTHRHYN